MSQGLQKESGNDAAEWRRGSEPSKYTIENRESQLPLDLAEGQRMVINVRRNSHAVTSVTAERHSFSIFGITSVAISLSERSACSSVSVPKKRYVSR